MLSMNDRVLTFAARKHGWGHVSNASAAGPHVDKALKTRYLFEFCKIKRNSMRKTRYLPGEAHFQVENGQIASFQHDIFRETEAVGEIARFQLINRRTSA